MSMIFNIKAGIRKARRGFAESKQEMMAAKKADRKDYNNNPFAHNMKPRSIIGEPKPVESQFKNVQEPPRAFSYGKKKR